MKDDAKCLLHYILPNTVTNLSQTPDVVIATADYFVDVLFQR